MAHFAELNGSNVVTRVIVVGNDITTAVVGSCTVATFTVSGTLTL